MQRNSSTNWKDKYFTALEKEEKRERQQQQILALLTRAVMKISLVADGIDGQLDKQLAGLRAMLSDRSTSGRNLKMLVDALEGQVKRVGAVKTERAKTQVAAFKSLVAQLKLLKPEGGVKKRLSQFDKGLKKRGSQLRENSSLIQEFSQLQEKVLKSVGQPMESKPFWHSWYPAEQGAIAEQNDALESENKSKENADDHYVADETSQPKLIIEGDFETLDEKMDEGRTNSSADMSSDDDSSSYSDLNVGLDLSDDVDVPRVQRIEKFSEEPSYSRLNKHIRDVLTELLDQIEPPILARSNYAAARKQIKAGLPWYELIPTLEDISLVVVTAFDLRRKDFEEYLAELNERLSQTYAFISESQQSQSESVQRRYKYHSAMQERMSTMRESVDNATELEQLKTEVNVRLDKIFSVMDQFQQDETKSELTLSEQLKALVDRVKTMELDSKTAEIRIEEQRQKALRDVLTQLPNREAYQLRLAQEVDRWRRYDRPLTLAVCDIDFFKRINDSYGHQAGDKVLRIIAKTLNKRLRKTDFIARIGGEEFVVLMPETNQEQALKVMEGVREAIASCPIHFKDERVMITMSFGVTEFIENDNESSAFSRADKALYEAKEGGRNRCVVAGEGG